MAKEDGLIKKTFEIEAKPEVMQRFERLLAMMVWSAGVGHTGIFGMVVDGDGPDRLKCEQVDKSLFKEVELISGVGYDVELALSNKYSGLFDDRERNSNFYTTPPGNLYKRIEGQEKDELVKKL